MFSIGVDVGGTGVKIGLVKEDGTILAKDSIPFVQADGWEKQLMDMITCADALVKREGYTHEGITSIGVGIPGIADQNTGVVYFCTNLGWKNVPLRETFQKVINRPVYIDNDATVAGLAESVIGASVGTHSSVLLTLGTGVGSGIVIGGKVWSGFHGTGSEIGHMILSIDGEPCTCGNRGCLERYCSATAIIRMARERLADYPDSLVTKACGGDPTKVNARMVIDAAREQDPMGTEVFGLYVKYLGQALANIANLLDPEVLVLGGGVSNAGSFLLDAVREEMLKYVLNKGLPYSRVALAKAGADAGMIGAAMLGR